MFERTLEEMTAIVTVEPGLFDLLTASNVGVPLGAVYLGSRRYSFAEAIQAIYAIDRALLSCAKAYQKRIRAQRMAFVFAFGPDMEIYLQQEPA